MASSLAGVLKAKSPDWQGVDDAEVERWAVEGLSSGRTARVLKKRIPEWQSLSDEDVNDFVRRKTSAPPPAAPVPTDAIKQQIQERKAGQREQASGQRIEDAKATLGQATTHTSADAKARADANAMLTYGRAPGEQSYVKEYLSFDDMKAAFPDAKMVPVNGEWQAQDTKTPGKVLGQLRPGRAVPDSAWGGGIWDAVKDTVKGTASFLDRAYQYPWRTPEQRAAEEEEAKKAGTEAAAWENVLGFVGNTRDYTGKAIAKVYRGLQYPWMPPDQRQPEDSTEGASELVQNESRRLGRAFPLAAAVAGSAAAVPAVTWNLAMLGKNKVEEALAEMGVRAAERNPDSYMGRKLEAERANLKTQREDLARHSRDLDAAVKDVWTPYDRWGSMTPEEGARIGYEVLGKRAADLTNLFNPAQDIVLGSKLLGAGGRALAKTELGQAVGEGAGRAAEKLADVSGFSNMPAKVGAPEQSRAMLEANQSIHREFPAMSARALMEEFTPRVGPERARKAILAWHDVDLRKAAVAADPGMLNAFEVLQPVHAQQALASGIAPHVYDPLHVVMGQDIKEAAVKARTAAQIDQLDQPIRKIMKAAGVPDQDVALGSRRATVDKYIDATNMDVPGLAPLRDNEQFWRKAEAVEGAPAQPARFLPGMRVNDSVEQRIANRLAAEMTKGDQAWSAASKAPGFMNWVGKITGSRMDEFDLEKMAREAYSHDAVTGLAATQQRLAAKDPRRLADAAYEILHSPRAVETGKADYGSASMSTLEDWAKQVSTERMAKGRAPLMDLADMPARLNAHGDERMRKLASGHREAEQVLGPDWHAELAARDEVIIMPAGKAENVKDLTSDIHPFSDGGRVVVMDLPPMPDGSRAVPIVRPRRYVMAVKQLMSQDKAKGARAIAQGIEHMLGLGQVAYAVTRGNMGFDARNFLGNGVRGWIDLGQPFLSEKERMETVRFLANPAERHRAEAVLGIGKDLRGKMPGANAVPAAPGLLPTRLRRWEEEAFEIAQNKFGGAYNEHVDGLLKDGWFRGAPANYSADDVLRAHHWRLQMKNGVDPLIAAQGTNRLLINYADKSGGEAMLRTVAPFVRFYTGAAQGALMLALKQPYRFSRIYRLHQAVQQADSDARGGKAVNAKARSGIDALMGMPIIGMDHFGMPDEAMVLRIDNPVSETKAVFDAGLGTFAPGLASQSDQRPTSLLHPGLVGAQSFFAAFPGADVLAKEATGYAPLSVPKDVWDSSSSMGGVIDRAYKIIRDVTPLPLPPNATYEERRKTEEENRIRAGEAMRIADDPGIQLRWDAFRRLPGVGPVVPVAFDSVVRAATGAGNVRNRTDQTRAMQFLRMFIRAMGPRTEGLDIQDAMGQKGADAARRRSKSVREENTRRGTTF